MRKLFKEYFGGLTVARKSEFFAKEAYRANSEQAVKLDQAFSELHHALEYFPVAILESLPAMFKYSKFRIRTSCTVFLSADGQKEFEADREDIVYAGEEFAVGHLIAYATFAKANEVSQPQSPSYLPALILRSLNIGILNDADKRALRAHGIGDAQIATLKGKVWRDIHAANELWVEVGDGKTFPEVLREFGLL